MRVQGGTNLYGFTVGILMLDTRFPRIPGDMGNATTFDFPVRYHRVTGASPDRIAGLTVVAPTAMLADALATAAFVLGTEHGLPFIQRQGVEALFVSPEIETTETPGFARYRR